LHPCIRIAKNGGEKEKILVQIIDIAHGSIADELGWAKGDQLVEINGRPVNDMLDYRFYSSEEYLEILVRRADEDVIYEVEKDYHEDLGVEVEQMKMMACGNNCVFCFVYQNPKGMRKPLYFKDEDYRFSFLYGHYVTLTTVTQDELERIVEQNLSPLFISVHATEENVRKLLLGIKREDHLMEKIRFLVEGGIELHTQIVLCPGINDGKIFDQTVNDLKKYYPGVKSIAVVPLGLTKHRKNLMEMRIHTQEELQDMIAYTNRMRDRLRKELEISYVYLSDEFFIKAGYPLPSIDYYDDFYQIENGVGEFRDMIENFNRAWRGMPKESPQPVRVTWVTGQLAAPSLDKFIVSKLRKIKGITIDLVAVKNEFYGHDITISGLLVGGDIYDQLKDRELGDVILLPPRVLNKDGYLLDDWTVEQLEEKLGRPCHVYTEELDEFVRVVNERKEMQ
jgi:putative radical SAM enzyme (TIGR03279 family)